MKNKKLVIACAAVLAAMAGQTAFGLSCVFNKDYSDWSIATNWANGVVPGVADEAYIRQGRTAVISSDVGVISNFFIGDNATTYGTGTGIVTIAAGGKLVVSSDGAQLGRQAAGAVGILNLNGGTLQIGDSTGSGRMYVGLDTTAGKNPAGFFNINGGTFNGRLLVGSTGQTGSTADKVTINGSTATIKSTSTAGYALEVRQTGTLNFIFDATGISTMDYGASGVGGSTTFGTGSQIIIDGSAYTGGSNTFTLIKAGTLGAKNCTVVLTNFANAGATYSWDQTADTFTVTTAVPEPATIGMLGLGTIAILFFRRQMRG